MLIILAILVYLGVAWIYALILSMIPLGGKNQFVLEGVQTFCTFDYIERELSTRLVMLTTNIFGFYLPITVILIFYFKIIKCLKNDVFTNHQVQIIKRRNSTIITLKHSDFNTSEMCDLQVKIKKINTEIRLIKNVVVIICVFCLSWGLYSILSLIGQFSKNREYLVTPLSTAVPALIGKTSTVVNPIIYIVRNKVFLKNIKETTKKHVSTNDSKRYFVFND
jgi:hypothetical protein